MEKFAILYAVVLVGGWGILVWLWTSIRDLKRRDALCESAHDRIVAELERVRGARMPRVG